MGGGEWKSKINSQSGKEEQKVQPTPSKQQLGRAQQQPMNYLLITTSEVWNENCKIFPTFSTFTWKTLKLNFLLLFKVTFPSKMSSFSLPPFILSYSFPISLIVLPFVFLKIEINFLLFFLSFVHSFSCSRLFWRTDNNKYRNKLPKNAKDAWKITRIQNEIKRGKSV